MNEYMSGHILYRLDETENLACRARKIEDEMVN